ncbi:MAG: lipoate--protein ligase [Eubacteriales bacterium]|nr:lipoate--protein ligase [Eubacteriales bacterium]
MLILRNNSVNPYFNLAAEQYLLDSDYNNILILWRNSPAVIIGQNQNAYAEVNDAYIREHNIALVRRLTGGGAVFHDLGNINYTFITPQTEGGALDFRRFCMPVIEALRNLGADAGMSGRNDIVIGGRKISGTAQCVRNEKTMHHGTLLFSADLSYMSGSLNVNAEKLNSKGIKSVSSRVGNIADLTEIKMNVTDFMDYLEGFFGGEQMTLTAGMTGEIQRLADSVYSTWEWNYGKSKAFEISRKRYFAFGLVEINLTLGGGIIRDIQITGDFFGRYAVAGLENTLRGTRCEYQNIVNILRGCDINSFIMGASEEDIAELMTG